jgi:hypothetical protein
VDVADVVGQFNAIYDNVTFLVLLQTVDGPNKGGFP